MTFEVFAPKYILSQKITVLSQYSAEIHFFLNYAALVFFNLLSMFVIQVSFIFKWIYTFMSCLSFTLTVNLKLIGSILIIQNASLAVLK